MPSPHTSLVPIGMTCEPQRREWASARTRQQWWDSRTTILYPLFMSDPGYPTQGFRAPLHICFGCDLIILHNSQTRLSCPAVIFHALISCYISPLRDESPQFIMGFWERGGLYLHLATYWWKGLYVLSTGDCEVSDYHRMLWLSGWGEEKWVRGQWEWS